MRRFALAIFGLTLTSLCCGCEAWQQSWLAVGPRPAGEPAAAPGRPFASAVRDTVARVAAEQEMAPVRPQSNYTIRQYDVAFEVRDRSYPTVLAARTLPDGRLGIVVNRRHNGLSDSGQFDRIRRALVRELGRSFVVEEWPRDGDAGAPAWAEARSNPGEVARGAH